MPLTVPLADDAPGDEEEKEPGIAEMLLENSSEHTASATKAVIIMMGVVMIFAVLWVAQDFFAPVLVAFVTGIILTPLSRLWTRLRLRPSLAALATLVIVLLGLAALVLLLEPFVSRAIDRAPLIWAELNSAIEGFRQMMQGLDKISEDVAASVGNAPGAASDGEDSVAVPTAADALLLAPQVLAQVMIFAGTLYFFLLVRDEVYAWVGASLSSLTREDFEHAESQVAQYFLTITAINACFGLIVAATLKLLNMPAPIFFGMMAFMLNFILYLGPIFMGAMLLVTGLVVFDGPIAVAPAGLYLAMNALEGQFITPAFIGQQMRVNPLLIFLSLVFWLWLWGPIGGIIAIPLMIWMIAMTEAVLGQTISSGIPGRLRPKRRAGADT